MTGSTRTFDFEAGELLLLDKPYTWTSFDVVNYIRNFLRVKIIGKKIKTGHAGTLDPLATGLLIVCTGRMTKSIQAIQDADKEYTGTLVLGATTPSFDLEKEIDARYPVDHINEDMVRQAALNLTGPMEQMPPVFSAIKIDGKRAYKFARKEQETIMKARPVEIYDFEVTGIAFPEVSFRVAVSKGTYIRSLVRDFGLALESGAYLKDLRRTRIGSYHIGDALDPRALTEYILQQSGNADTMPA